MPSLASARRVQARAACTHGSFLLRHPGQLAHLRSRAGPLSAGQSVRRQGAHLQPGLWAQGVAPAGAGDGVLRRGAAARRLREDVGGVQERRRAAGGQEPHLRVAARLQARADRARRPADEHRVPGAALLFGVRRRRAVSAAHGGRGAARAPRGGQAVSGGPHHGGERRGDRHLRRAQAHRREEPGQAHRVQGVPRLPPRGRGDRGLRDARDLIFQRCRAEPARQSGRAHRHRRHPAQRARVGGGCGGGVARVSRRAAHV